MKKILCFVSMMILLLVSVTWAQESPLTITDMKAESTIVNSGGKVLISCRVKHTQDPMLIRQVAATVKHGKWNTSYPILYDDGTYGDMEPEDGIYSLEITAPEALIAQINFNAVDTNGNEIASELIF